MIQALVIRSHVKAGYELKPFKMLGYIPDCAFDASLAFDMGARGCQMRCELIKEYILGLMQYSLGGISPKGQTYARLDTRVYILAEVVDFLVSYIFSVLLFI